MKTHHAYISNKIQFTKKNLKETAAGYNKYSDTKLD